MDELSEARRLEVVDEMVRRNLVPPEQGPRGRRTLRGGSGAFALATTDSTLPESPTLAEAARGSRPVEPAALLRPPRESVKGSKDGTLPGYAVVLDVLRDLGGIDAGPVTAEDWPYRLLEALLAHAKQRAGGRAPGPSVTPLRV
jgi:hypothetical protein